MNNLRKAAEDMLNRYVRLVDSGDCGWWNPEEEKEVIALRQALAQPEWVELTEDEYLDILNSSDGVYEYLTKLEAKLKEKNT